MPIDSKSAVRHLEEGEVLDDGKENSSKKDVRARDENEPRSKRKKVDKETSIATKTGGAYIPPAKLRLMQQQITDKSRYGSIRNDKSI